MKSIKINNLEISNNKPFILFVGPCVIEKRDHALKIAESIYDICNETSTQFIFKEAHSSYATQAWRPHQDSLYPEDKNGQYITSNWFLRGADVENGTIYVYPGSHELGLLEATPQVSFRENANTNPGSECKIPKEYFDKKVDVIIPKNSVLFLHGHCIHGSYSNNSDRSRPWFSCCYISKGEKYHVGANAQRKEIELR